MMPTGEAVAQATAGPDGAYLLADIPAGTYLLVAAASGYGEQWYAGSSDPSSADPLVLDASSAPSPTIDFSLTAE